MTQTQTVPASERLKAVIDRKAELNRSIRSTQEEVRNLENQISEAYQADAAGGKVYSEAERGRDRDSLSALKQKVESLATEIQAVESAQRKHENEANEDRRAEVLDLRERNASEAAEIFSLFIELQNVALECSAKLIDLKNENEALTRELESFSGRHVQHNFPCERTNAQLFLHTMAEVWGGIRRLNLPWINDGFWVPLVNKARESFTYREYSVDQLRNYNLAHADGQADPAPVNPGRRPEKEYAPLEFSTDRPVIDKMDGVITDPKFKAAV